MAVLSLFHALESSYLYFIISASGAILWPNSFITNEMAKCHQLSLHLDEVSPSFFLKMKFNKNVEFLIRILMLSSLFSRAL